MVLKSEDVNYLVYRYLKESGFLHSSYTFQFESQLHKAQAEQPNVEPGALIRVLQKGLQYMDVETHLNEDGTARLCTAPFTLVGKHTCSVQPPTPPDTRPSTKPKETSNTAAHGGHTLVHDASRKSNKPKVNSIDNETAADDVEEEDRMDVDVPDTESNTQKALKKSRSVDRVEYLSGHTAAVFLCAWNPALPATLATGSGDGTVRLWDAAARQNSAASVAVLRHSSHEGRADVTALCWNPQGTLLATVSFAGHLRLWSAQGDLRATLRNRPVPVVAMKWNRRGTLLAAACLDGSISLWETPSGRLRHEYRGHTGSVLDVDWHDGLLASCAADRTIIIWRDSDTTPLKTLVGHTADVNAISWHPTGKYLASASDDGSLRIWTPQSDTPLQHEFLGHSQQVYSVKWLPRSDKAIIASASFDVMDANSSLVALFHVTMPCSNL
ncbi:hypothetical protein GGI07_003510 [Coemansia sp. Benny D115]|nr:hypothetical protein GGI07_003510 [Coemansia sp. Benny D115]